MKSKGYGCEIQLWLPQEQSRRLPIKSKAGSRTSRQSPMLISWLSTNDSRSPEAVNMIGEAAHIDAAVIFLRYRRRILRARSHSSISQNSIQCRGVGIFLCVKNVCQFGVFENTIDNVPKSPRLGRWCLRLPQFLAKMSVAHRIAHIADVSRTPASRHDRTFGPSTGSTGGSLT
jgi:hypothetical protein